MEVNEGTPLVEIAISVEPQNAPQDQPAEERPEARAARSIAAAQAEIEAARAEVVRHEVEVHRLTPLVASGAASQGQLDGARAEYERAQQRLQRAQTTADGAHVGLIIARQQSLNQTTRVRESAPEQKLVTARASSKGTVSAISAKAGDRVAAGQPLATLRASEERP